MNDPKNLPFTAVTQSQTAPVSRGRNAVSKAMPPKPDAAKAIYESPAPAPKRATVETRYGIIYAQGPGYEAFLALQRKAVATRSLVAAIVRLSQEDAIARIDAFAADEGQDSTVRRYANEIRAALLASDEDLLHRRLRAMRGRADELKYAEGCAALSCERPPHPTAVPAVPGQRLGTGAAWRDA